MQKRSLSKKRTRTAASPAAVLLNWQYLLIMLVCGAVLAGGFFFAARQHFISMDYGFKNSRLRKQLEELEAEKRRLLLAREVALSPSEIRKATRTVAMQTKRTAQSVPLANRAAEQAVAVKDTVKPPVVADSDRGRLARIVYSEPSKASTQSDRPVTRSARDGRDTEMVAVAKLR